MAKSKAVNWLIGCGVGCGVLVLLMVGLGVGAGVWVRDTLDGFKQAAETEKTLLESQGEAEEFVPAADGAIPPARMEAFLAVREETRPARDGVRTFFESIPMSEDEARELEAKPFLTKLGSVMRITGAAVGFAQDLGELFAARNAALESYRMGLGEYTYIYVLAYHSYLGNSPEDGPGDGEDVDLRGGMNRTQRRIQNDLIAILGNQLAALRAAGGPEASELAARLESEIEALEESRWRVPWAEGVPEPVRRSLEEYRSELEASYSPITNPFELGRPEQRGGFSVDVN